MEKQEYQIYSDPEITQSAKSHCYKSAVKLHKVPAAALICQRSSTFSSLGFFLLVCLFFGLLLGLDFYFVWDFLGLFVCGFIWVFLFRFWFVWFKFSWFEWVFFFFVCLLF